MIFFLVKKYHEYSIGNYLQSWARPLIGRVGIITYEECAFATRLHRGTYVFTDFERMSETQLALARDVAPQIARAGCRVLNDPARVLGRADLLRKLHESGLNSFRCFRDGEDLAGLRFPCFVRRASDHMGAMSALIDSHEALDRELATRRQAGHRDILIIERVDVRNPDGFYRKYGVFGCADRFIARHLYVSEAWVQNSSGLVDEAKVAEETAYIDSNPHEQQVRQVFALAGTDYGRVDYGLLDGRMQVWEINTNPMMMAAPYRIDPRRLPGLARATAKATAAIESIDDGRPFDADKPENYFAVEVDPHLRADLGVKPGDNALRLLGRALGRIGRLPGVRDVVETCQRARWLASR